jgi:hypothetical protein
MYRQLVGLIGLLLWTGRASNCSWATDEVWIGPCPSSPDMISLFTSPDDWATTRSGVGVFQFFAQQLLPGPCTICGAANNLSTWTSLGAVQQLENWGIGISVELGALKSFDCQGIGLAQQAIQIVNTVKSLSGNGSPPRWLAMDEPLQSAVHMGCNMSQTQAAVAVASWMTTVRDSDATVGVGDVEPYPAFSADELCSWIDTLRTATQSVPGGPPAFFHLDIDWNAVGKNVDKSIEDINRIKGCCDTLGGIGFGGIINAFPVTTDLQYSQLSQQHFDYYIQSVTRTSRMVFESWNWQPPITPLNLPDSNPSSNTGLVKQACKL